MAGPTDDELIAAGLYDPDDTTVVGRLDLLRWLADEGFTVAEMQRGLESGALGAMASDRWLLGGPTFGRDEAIRRSGLSEATFDACTVALGLTPVEGATDSIAFTDELLHIHRAVAGLEEYFSPPEVMALVRTIGSSIDRLAESAVGVFLTDIESDHVNQRRSEYELGQLVLGATKLLEGLGSRLDPLLRRHVLQAIERTRASTIDEFERFQFTYAVGFVDLVGFTPMSAAMTARELVAFMADFEARSHEVALAEGARVVKLIGDEVMFVATDPDRGCRAGAALIDTFAADGDGVAPRGGMAFGPVALRGGDYFGSVVNLASRLTDDARPGELLVSTELAAAARACAFQPAGRRHPKGFAEPIDVYSLARS